jgi:glycosyltransferase involved in cell wall biosynthesis
MKALVSAYACEPDKGSEPGVGWNWVLQHARNNDVWVLTRANNRDAIEASSLVARMTNVKWIYYDLPNFWAFWKRGRRGVHLYYYLWQVGAFFVARRIHREVQFDIIHHATFVTYWLPSFLPYLPVPFVWGPVGGGEVAPKTFFSTLGWRGKFYQILRRVAQAIARRDPFVRRTAQRAIVTLATTPETAERTISMGASESRVFSQIALCQRDLDELGHLPLRSTLPVRFVSIGNFLDWKGFHLGLEAFSRISKDDVESEYWLVGDGPERSRLISLAKEYDVLDRVTFLGQMNRRQVFSVLGTCDVLVHPSLHDSGGGVCIEAMAAGRPVICLDLGGPAIQVTDDTGIKVRALEPEQTIFELSGAMKTLATDPVTRTKMGLAAQQRARQHFHWDIKGDDIQQVFREVIEIHGSLRGGRPTRIRTSGECAEQ